jgi:hypothetical protein
MCTSICSRCRFEVSIRSYLIAVSLQIKMLLCFYTHSLSLGFCVSPLLMWLLFLFLRVYNLGYFNKLNWFIDNLILSVVDWKYKVVIDGHILHISDIYNRMPNMRMKIFPLVLTDVKETIYFLHVKIYTISNATGNRPYIFTCKIHTNYIP